MLERSCVKCLVSETLHNKLHYGQCFFVCDFLWNWYLGGDAVRIVWLADYFLAFNAVV